MAAEKTAGQWLAFPRDDVAVEIIRDGRWKLEPNPVDWVIMSSMAYPLGVRPAPAIEVTAILMSPPSECFALCAPHQNEGHHSMYLSLFGRDLRPDEVARARARLVIAGRLTDGQIVKAYEAYQEECAAK